MNTMQSEINEIPIKASNFLKLSPSYSLPLGVPYLGMGSSYFAPLAFKYMGVPIFPEIASEYFNSYSGNRKSGKAVIISQSGQSSEALWCARLFRSYIAITNDAGSELSKNKNVSGAVSILAGSEKYSSSKSYINTLLALLKDSGLILRRQSVYWLKKCLIMSILVRKWQMKFSTRYHVKEYMEYMLLAADPILPQPMKLHSF